jgi:hypothetical protein
MVRVARRAVLAIESRDSLLMRIAVRAGAAGEYELEAVVAHDFRAGGVRNSALPNYVYRWNEREIEKTVAAFEPWARHRFRFFREFELPESLLEMRRNRLAAAAVRATKPVVAAITRAFPSQGNLFAFVVEKTGELQPWVERVDGELRPHEQFIRKRIRG